MLKTANKVIIIIKASYTNNFLPLAFSLFRLLTHFLSFEAELLLVYSPPGINSFFIIPSLLAAPQWNCKTEEATAQRTDLDP